MKYVSKLKPPSMKEIKKLLGVKKRLIPEVEVKNGKSDKEQRRDEDSTD